MTVAITTGVKYDPATRVRPLRPGYLIENSNVRGTICAIVEMASGEIALLSSSHIFPAKTVSVQQPPGPPVRDYQVAVTPLSVSPSQGAIATVYAGLTVDQSLPDGSAINGIAEDVRPGTVVKMYGGGSGYIQGTITSVNATANVTEEKGPVRLSGVIYANFVSHPGDVGAPVFSADNRLVGMLYGGTQDVSFILPIRTILDQLNVRLLPAGVRTASGPRPSVQQQQKAR